MKVGAEVVYRSGVVQVQAQVHRHVTHEAEGYEEWGAGGPLRVSPGASSLVPAGGSASPAAGRVDAELGRGLPALRGRGVLTPYARAALAAGYGDARHLGTRLLLASSLALSLEGNRRDHVGNDAAHDLALRASMPWQDGAKRWGELQGWRVLEPTTASLRGSTIFATTCPRPLSRRSATTRHGTEPRHHRHHRPERPPHGRGCRLPAAARTAARPEPARACLASRERRASARPAGATGFQGRLNASTPAPSCPVRQESERSKPWFVEAPGDA